MGRIKTRESVKDIKILDKAAVASERMKTALVRSKDQAENLMDDGQISPSEYAEDKIRYAAEDVTDQFGTRFPAKRKKPLKKARRRTGSTVMKSASTKMKNGFAAMRRSCVGARQAERRERRLHGRQRGKIRRPHGQASGADETRPSNLRSVPNAPSSSLLALPGNRP